MLAGGEGEALGARRSREPLGRARVLVYEASDHGEGAVATALRNEGYEPIVCAGAEALLEEAVKQTSDVVICALLENLRSDLGVLRLLRRAAPQVPLVLVVSDDSLKTHQSLQGLRPMYYAILPLERGELAEAVRAAVARRPQRGR